MAKRKLKVLEAVVTGCVWDCDAPHLDLLQPYAVCMLEPLHGDETNTPEDKASQQQRNEQRKSMLVNVYYSNSAVTAETKKLRPFLCVEDIFKPLIVSLQWNLC